MEHPYPFGATIRSIRESRGLSVDAVAECLKIDKRLITAFEQENFSAFSAHVYARGIFEKYARFLKLDASEALHIFEDAWHEAHKDREKAAIAPVRAPRSGIYSHVSKRALSVGAVGAGIAAVMILLGYAIYHARSPVFSLIEPEDRIITHDFNMRFRGVANPRTELTLNKQPVYIGSDGAFQVTVMLHPGVNILTLEGRTTFGTVSKIERHIVVQ